MMVKKCDKRNFIPSYFYFKFVLNSQHDKGLNQICKFLPPGSNPESILAPGSTLNCEFVGSQVKLSLIKLYVFAVAIYRRYFIVVLNPVTRNRVVIKILCLVVEILM